MSHCYSLNTHLLRCLSNSKLASSVVNVDFELNIEKHDLHLRFMLTTLIHIKSTFKYAQ